MIKLEVKSRLNSSKKSTTSLSSRPESKPRSARSSVQKTSITTTSGAVPAVARKQNRSMSKTNKRRDVSSKSKSSKSTLSNSKKSDQKLTLQAISSEKADCQQNLELPTKKKEGQSNNEDLTEAEWHSSHST